MTIPRGICFLMIVLLTGGMLSGCAAPVIKSSEAHRKGMEPLTEEGYIVPPKPVDRHFIGYPWSRQFGPVENAGAPDIRVRMERSLDNVLQQQAYNRGISLGGEAVTNKFEILHMRSKGGSESQLSGLEIISPVSLADIPFEPNVMYVTEALRLTNFRIKEKKTREFGIGALSTKPLAVGQYSADPAGEGWFASEGNGLVVGYKLHTIDVGSYQKRESGSVPLELGKTVELTGSGMLIQARLVHIEPGAGTSLPRNLLWACPRADAVSRDMVAAWLVDIRSTDPAQESLTVAFPGYPHVDNCQYYSGMIRAGIDPVTDRIVRQKIALTLLDAELSDALQTKVFSARVSVIDESFNVRLVRPDEIEGGIP